MEHKENSPSHEQKIPGDHQGTDETTDRFMSLADYDVKTEVTVKFEFGSSSIPEESKGALKTLAKTATGLKGYIIEVTGHADSAGHDAINTKLSEDRARAVITYLMQQGGVPVRHIVAPGAMGEYAPWRRMRLRPDGPRTVGLRSKSSSTRASSAVKRDWPPAVGRLHTMRCFLPQRQRLGRGVNVSLESGDWFSPVQWVPPVETQPLIIAST